MKALILSCNTGQGHNSAGQALINEFNSMGIECDMTDTLAFGSEFASDVVSKIHAKCVLNAPALFAAGYKAAAKIDDKALKLSPCYVANATYSNELYKYITDNGYDTIIMPHVFPSEALTHIKRRHSPALRTYFIGTDYAYPPFLKDTDVDRYIIAHKDLSDEFAQNGISREKLVPLGIPVSQKFLVNTDKKEARHDLGLPQEGNVILVMTGSMGFGDNTSFISLLLKSLPQDTNVVVMGGNNEKMKTELRREFFKDSRLQVLDFTDKVSLYMDAADILFTKPGGLSTTEAAVKGIPFIHSSPIPGWEESNVKFFKSHGMSLAGESPDELVTAALYLLGNPWKCEKMVEAQNSQINKYAARDICEYILQDSGR